MRARFAPFLFSVPPFILPLLFMAIKRWGPKDEGGEKKGSEKVFDGEPKGRRITFATKYFGESGSG